MNNPTNHLADTAQTAETLTQTAQPLGWAVTYTGRITNTGRTDQQFTLHRIDQPVASGPSFDTAEQVTAHLDELAQQPRWELDPSTVITDNIDLTVTDQASGESFCLKGWNFGLINPDVPVVHAETPPRIGSWHKVTT